VGGDWSVALTNGKHRVETLPQVSAWIAQHGGEVDEKWRHQEALNEKMDSTIQNLFDRIDTLTTRIGWITGVAFGLGGIIAVAAHIVQAWGSGSFFGSLR
jgi:hypothetical protein